MFWKFTKRVVAAVGFTAAVWAGTPAAVAQQVVAPVELPPVGAEGPPPVTAVPMEGPQATLSGLPIAGGCGIDCLTAPAGCGEGGCYPGRDCCAPIEGRGPFTRLYAAYHNALCCPDPCYVPKWNPVANAAFFVDHARPTTMTRLRWEHGENLIGPDRAEYFWAQIGGPGPANPETRVDYDELHLYQEVGTDKFSAFIDLPYRSQRGQVNGGSGGIGDLRIGTKSLLLDSELLQFTFQFVTSIPTAGPGGGIGTGHVSLDPSILTTLKLREDTYLQSQMGYWFGVGNSNGSILHYHNSLNQVLLRPTIDTSLIGTFETNGYSFMSGQVTLPSGARVQGNDVTYFTLGPGLRWAMCDKLDFGIGMQFAVTQQHFAQRQYRTEIRFRF